MIDSLCSGAVHMHLYGFSHIGFKVDSDSERGVRTLASTEAFLRLCTQIP